MSQASEEESSVMESSTSDSHTSGRDQQTKVSEESLARSESRRVKRSKWLVSAVMFFAAAAVAISTYFFSRNEENNNFEAEFHASAVEIADLVHVEASNVFGAVESLSTTITSYSDASGTQWPEVSIPHFEVRGQANNRLSKALQVTLAPLVKIENKAGWENYATLNQEWIEEAVKYAEDPQDQTTAIPSISEHVWRFSNDVDGEAIVQNDQGISFGPGQFAPVWQQSPAPRDPSIINFDLLSHPTFQRIYHGMWETKKAVISETTELDFLYGGAIQDDVTHPHSFLLEPIYPSFLNDKADQDSIIGILIAVIGWDTYLSNLLPEDASGIAVVLHNTCGNHYTYHIEGSRAVFIGPGDLHEAEYDDLLFSTPFAPFMEYDFSDKQEHCEYDLRIYPTSALQDQYTSNKPIVYSLVVLAVFFFTFMVFALYDHFVNVRQQKVVAAAKRTNAIVKSLFPANVRDRILKDAEDQAKDDLNGTTIFGFKPAPKTQLKDFLDSGDDNKSTDGSVFTENPHGSKPIADLFPFCTVLFADIVGFTAWSSVREPTQVFTLLETLYHAFDEIAKHRKVFKVETIGDCYVAVTGLPEPRKDHAVTMCRFARDCLKTMNDLTKRLEVSLGPDTGDLSIRIGLHSGPVTAGVLRGDKSRFQLFGDTVNTASRMESTGERNRIQLSGETAQLLNEAGKSHWTKPREGLVQAKGKGEMATFWLVNKVPSGSSCHSGSSVSDDAPEETDTKELIAAGLAKEGVDYEMDPKIRRLVEWNTDVLTRLLRQVVARRESYQSLRATEKATTAPVIYNEPGMMVIDEIKEVIHLPDFDPEVAKKQESPESVHISEDVISELREFVRTVALLYRDNPFHNFEHASHVTMSVVKLLSRIVAPDLHDGASDSTNGVASTLHDHTYGITSDPLTQFACVFAALIHDVDHTGVPNAQLVKEKAAVAGYYKGKSVAEQNSVDISWNLLNDDKFTNLRSVICCNETELRHFRQLIVNGVMATDIVDKELKTLRNNRWDTAFYGKLNGKDPQENIHRKATIVIEHLIQASDIAHTMQHWHIYRKWNERLFQEMFKAFKEGRAEKNPADFWYKGEIGFFDFYILPLAKKLDDCGVFGVSSDEYLNYAQKNRSEWENKGAEVVAKMVEKYESKY